MVLASPPIANLTNPKDYWGRMYIVYEDTKVRYLDIRIKLEEKVRRN